jgi:hypothetical protein
MFIKNHLNPLYKRIVYTKMGLYAIGSILTVALSLSEILRGREKNYFIFAHATRDFWHGINPYTQQWSDKYGLDHFLYGPLFNILFTPFALLPFWLGALAWNFINFSIYFHAIFSLPESIGHRKKCMIFLYTLPILGTTQLSFQYNVTVAYLLIYAFIFLEKNKSFAAVCLILIGGFTKIYGFVFLPILMFYPKLCKNIGYVLLTGLFLFLLPAVKVPLTHLAIYYEQWLRFAFNHPIGRTWETVFYIEQIFPSVPSYLYLYQLSVLFLLGMLILLNYKKFGQFKFRLGSAGILSGWMILFSTAAEKHTYIIALSGYLLWYSTIIPNKIDRILFWLNFIILVIMPIDLLCPPAIMKCVFGLHINLWLFLFTWLIMVYRTLLCKTLSNTIPSNR